MTYQFQSSAPPNNVIFNTKDNVEILRIAPDGFYVRGVKLEQDETEARKVFDAMSDWLKFMGRI